MILDYHVHLGKSSSGSNYTVDDLVNTMDKFNVEKSGLSILNGVDTRVLNDQVYEAYLKYPDRIVPFAYINPREPWAIEEVHRTLGELKFKGVKMHSWKCGYTPDNNLSLDKIINEIEPYNVSLLTHTGTAPLSLPQSWAEVAKRHPNQLFVFAHIGYLDYGYSCVHAVKDLPNVMVDTAGQVEVQVLELAFKELGADRILFSTDWPYKYHGSEISKFEILDLTEEEKRKVFYENCKKLFDMGIK